MSRRTLDILISIGALVMAGLLVIAAVVLTNEASFSKDYVRDQLSQQKITFTAADKLTAEDRAFTEARTGCTIEYAGQPLATGRQAECYANEYINSHLSRMPSADNPMTYSEIGQAQSALRAQIATAKENNDPALPDLQKQLDDLTASRETVFKGEMLRGALLSALGEKAALAATVAFIGAGILLVLSLAGFAHAFVTPRTRAFAPAVRPVEPQPL